jgi:hypothetical protein
MEIQLQFNENSTSIQWKFNFNSMEIQLQFNGNSTSIQWKFQLQFNELKPETLAHFTSGNFIALYIRELSKFAAILEI